jgi:hypothetical protein
MAWSKHSYSPFLDNNYSELLSADETKEIKNVEVREATVNNANFQALMTRVQHDLKVAWLHYKQEGFAFNEYAAR